MVPEFCWRPSRIGPHQVTYEAAAHLVGAAAWLMQLLVVIFGLGIYDSVVLFF